MNKALSCVYVKHSNLGYVLVCIFLIYYPDSSSKNIIAFIFIKVTTTNLELASSNYNKYFYYSHNALCFKTVENIARNKLVIAGYCKDGLLIYIL